MSHVYRSGYTRPHALSVAAMVNMLLRFLLVLAIISGTSFAVKEQQKSLLKDLEGKHCRAWQKNSECNVQVLQYTTHFVDALCCLVDNASGKKHFWSQLAHILHQLDDKLEDGESELTRKAFAEAKTQDGVVPSVIREWNFLGPFPIGKMEVDGDPVSGLGGAYRAYKESLGKHHVYRSELTSNASLTWIKLKAEKSGEVHVSPIIDWRDLVSSLGSTGIMEWQGWSVGEFYVNQKAVVLVRCLGVHTIYIDDYILAADIYRRDWFWFSIHLSVGLHVLSIRLRTKVQLTYQCHLKQSGNLRFELHQPHYVPDIVEGQLVSSYVALPVVNHALEKGLKDIRVTVIEQTGAPSISVSLATNRLMIPVARGQVSFLPLLLESQSTSGKKGKCQDVKLSLKLSASSAHSQQIDIKLRCRSKKESFLFTFEDHDGSIQHAAAIAPKKKCPSSGCPVVLTLHGTGVPPQNQADSYKRMKEKNWVFGLDTAWVLAPTRHGAHNWEGPGMLTSITALKQLSEISRKMSWTPDVAWTKVVFAGHSMGGHGAWHLATHHPDSALAVISAAGWIAKEEYGDSNLFFCHDVSVSFTDPALKAILEACVAENMADHHVSNLRGVPVLARVGAVDRTVHPYYGRRMYRLLEQAGVNVSYAELPGKEHWWWDTWSENDGGVNSDPVVRKFVEYFTVPHKDGWQNRQCYKNKDCVTDSRESKYSGSAGALFASETSRLAGQYTLSVFNPASHKGLRGVQVILQLIPMRKSKVQIDIREESAVLHTSNVKMLQLQPPDVAPIYWQSMQDVTIDGMHLPNLTSDSEDSLSLYRNDDGSWEKVSSSLAILALSRYGPARRVAESPFLIVVGKDTTVMHMALYIANLFHLTSDTLAPIVTDSDIEPLQDQYNLIILGQPEENTLIQSSLLTTPISYENKGFRLGRCHFSSNHTGVAAIGFHSQHHQTLILTGNSAEALKDIVHLATPTIPPMTRSPFSNLIPDFVITGHDFKAFGTGGYLCAGFWDQQIRDAQLHTVINKQSISCAC